MDVTQTYPKEAMQAAIDALKKNGITNVDVQAAILATIAKESGFVPKSEMSYANTTNARIRQIFGSRVADLSEPQLSALKTDNIEFFDKIYGGRYGNTAKGDGWKYRGRGDNQITFKDVYKRIGTMIGVDLVANPDKLNEPATAAAAAAAYFVAAFKDGKTSGKLKEKIGVNDIAEIKDSQTAVKAAIQANAGWGTNFNAVIVQEGYKKALATVQGFKSGILNAFKIIAENKGKAGLVAFFLLHWQQVTTIVSL